MAITQSENKKQFNPKEIQAPPEDVDTFFVPHLIFGPEGAIFNQEILKECNRVGKLVLKCLKAPIEELKQYFNPSLLVDFKARNEKDQNTFPRTELGTKYINVPVVIYSLFPVYDSFGTEAIAIYSPANKVIFISLKLLKLSNQFTETFSKSITKPGDLVLKKEILDQPEIMAGIAMIEEMIHFVQMHHWGESSEQGTSSSQTVEEHDEDPIEEEARIIKNALIKLIYPQYISREISKDLFTELPFAVSDACANAKLVEEPVSTVSIEAIERSQIALEFSDLFSEAHVDSMDQFPELVRLALRQILMTTLNLSEEDIDAEENKEHYMEWTEYNTRKLITQMQLFEKVVLKFPNLKIKPTIQFIKTPEGKLRCRPMLNVHGALDTQAYNQLITLIRNTRLQDETL